MNSLKKFFSCIQFLQNLRSFKPYYLFEKIYHSLFKYFFKLSSVSVIFRICLKSDVITKINEEQKKQIEGYILEYVNDEKNFINKSNANWDLRLSTLKIETLEGFLYDKFYNLSCVNFDNLDSLFEVEILFK